MTSRDIIAYKLRYLFLFAFVIGIVWSVSDIGTAYASGVRSVAITITFDATGGDSDVSDMLATYGDTYGVLPEATRVNYEFIGWYSYASGGIKVTETTKVIKPLDHTLYARWRGEETEITLEADGGSLSSKTIKAYYGSKFSNQLPTPTKTSFIFTGWYTSLIGGEKITVKSIFTENSPTTLYAHWTEKPVKVIFISFNGESYEQEVANGLAYGELPEPEKENYVFGGWYKFKDYTSHKAKPITADTIVDEVGQIKLFARWYFDSDTVN
ncbi:MAG: internalin-like protein [Herbinix sp.]|nr:internalin-like protein [Herbinix sp.]